MQIIEGSEIADLISMKEAIIQMEWAFEKIYNNSKKIPIRSNIEFNETDSALVMPGFIEKHPYFICKVINISSSRKPSISGTINVYSIRSGNLLAIMDAGSVTQLRTGAASGLATKYLSNEDSMFLCVFGTGAQAFSQIEAILEVRNISNVGIVSTSDSKSLDFSKKIREFFSIDCYPLDPHKIPQNSIICTATTSQLPLFHDTDIPSGCHINAIGSYKPFSREIPSGIVIRSKVVVDDLKSCSIEAGDLIIPENEKRWSMEKIHCELGELVLGLASARENNKEVTLFKSVGNVIQDLAIVNRIMDQLGKN